MNLSPEEMELVKGIQENFANLKREAALAESRFRKLSKINRDAGRFKPGNDCMIWEGAMDEIGAKVKKIHGAASNDLLSAYDDGGVVIMGGGGGR